MLWPCHNLRSCQGFHLTYKFSIYVIHNIKQCYKYMYSFSLSLLIIKPRCLKNLALPNHQHYSQAILEQGPKILRICLHTCPPIFPLLLVVLKRVSCLKIHCIRKLFTFALLTIFQQLQSTPNDWVSTRSSDLLSKFIIC